MSLLDLFRSDLEMSDGEEELQDEKASHFWNPIIKKSLEVEDLLVIQAGVSQNSSTNRLLMNNLMTDAGRLMYCIRRAQLDLWIG